MRVLLNEDRSCEIMRNLLAMALVSCLCLSVASAGGESGVNRAIDVEDTPIESITTPTISTDGTDFTITVTLSDEAGSNGTTVEWTVQQCINSGVCNPPERISMTGSNESWSSTIVPVDTHSYINYDVVLIYPNNESEKFPEAGFGEGGKVWSDCWVSGEDSGGEGCSAEESAGFLPAPTAFLTLVLTLSAALVVKREN
ncbi:MAG: hypothetical protein VYC11_04140 [Candidatus Thermoplasmatota archaeon]|nr:hypothetical protein [Candidatus Thermoplasmatota archaeon]